MKKFAALLVVAALASFGLVACGGGSDTSSESSSTSGGTTETTEKGEAEGGTAGPAGAVEIEADPSGNLAFTSDSASAKAGKVTVDFTNSSPVPHDVTIEGEGGETLAQTEVFAEASESVSANLNPGTYTFYCSVPGHREAGMEGTLTVK
ncbi:MAG TPA: plastocyanin/azurin family copper-binding protein [Solirubrobacterales bacterium]|nr:plastocyanin/azurin family copper-binding protein [Solirubrobacterales bacterium]